MPARQTVTVTTTTHSRSRSRGGRGSSGVHGTRSHSSARGNGRRCPGCGRYM